uniref:Gastrin-releasing peptide n=1 Tax=Anabas testudineus TaxID=64144 RepID=A0AAQ6IFN1_ANATE
MSGVCLCYPRTCRPLWPVFLFLATLPSVLHSIESPAAVVGKMYPRGNHWAVGRRHVYLEIYIMVVDLTSFFCERHLQVFWLCVYFFLFSSLQMSDLLHLAVHLQDSDST